MDIELNYKSVQGFSLIDSIVSIAFLSIFLPSLMSMLSTSKMVADNANSSFSVLGVVSFLDSVDKVSNVIKLVKSEMNSTLKLQNPTTNFAIVCSKSNNYENNISMSIYENSNIDNIFAKPPVIFNGLSICDINKESPGIFSLKLKSYKNKAVILFKTKSYTIGGY